MGVRVRMTTTPPLLRPVTDAPNAPVRPIQLAAAAIDDVEQRAAKRKLSPVRGDNDASAVEGERGNTLEGGERVSLA